MLKEVHDFSQGSVAGNITRLAIPLIFAQLVNVLYSVIDRIYIGHLPYAATNALTGVGITFPVISIVIAFACLFGMGGGPLFAIARGSGDEERARYILGNTFILLLCSGFVLLIVGEMVKEPLLYLFGASDITFPYANEYLTVYLWGSAFVMLSLGLNGFINAQGFGRQGMITVLLGATINMVLDPLFLFVFHWGVAGAAFATVLSQGVSAIWAVRFLCSKQALVPLRFHYMKLNFSLVKNIAALGLSSFIMNVTNSGVQIVCNATLKLYGGDLYVGVMTVLNSLREVATAPASGLVSAAQPIIGYNYGAKCYHRVRQGILFMSLVCVVYTSVAWLIFWLFPRFFIALFNQEAALIEAAVPAMHLYFFGFFMMSLQMAGQTSALALGRSKQAIFFSLLRKAVIVIPLTLLLPRWAGLGVNGVFLAEPISNFIGGAACYITMLLTVWMELKRRETIEKQQET